MRYQDEQRIKELERLLSVVFVWFVLAMATIILITVLTVKGCSNTVAPVNFKEQYTPTKFNKL
jgi:hypothetical protein